MNLLALETSTEALSIAVRSGDKVVSRHELAPRRHAELSLPWSDELLASAGLRKRDLDAIAIGRGPGAFTGVRLAIAMGQGIAFALGKPLIGISTLAILAQGAVRLHGATQVLAVIDARMDEVYAARFTLNGSVVSPVSEEIVIAPSELDISGVDGSWVVVGTGIDAVNGALRSRLQATGATLVPDALPDALDLLTLAQAALDAGMTTTPEQVEPAYLRNKVALTIAERESSKTKG